MKSKITQKHYLVFGAGVSGQAAYMLLCTLGAVATLVEGNGPEDISGFDGLVLSPGIPREHELVKKFLKSNKEVIGEIELSSRYITTPIIGVTGSNGKTTVCMMIHDFLCELGHKVFLGGNIGVPLAQAALCELNGEKFDYIVCELSSFQLESISSFTPHVSAILNLSFTHQERYRNFDDYILAKAHIADYQDENQTVLICQSPVLEGKLAKSRVKKKLWKQSSEYGFSFMKLIGEHNKLNFQHCFQIVKELGVNFTNKQAQSFIANFTGAEYRIQRVGSKGRFIFYNDAKSTNLKSTCAAIECFIGKSLILICGGKQRDDSISDFKKISDYQFESVYCTGESGQELSTLLSSNLNTEYYKSLDRVLFEITKKIKTLDGDHPVHVLFSPGFPSFDQYRNYKERGEHFNRLVLG